jgi:hypothetical protein
MDKNIIKNRLNQRFISEEATPGIKVTDAAKNKSKKINQDGVKAIEKDVKAYDKDLKQKDKDMSKMAPNKFNYADDQQKTYHDEMEIMNGQEMIQYDLQPNKEFSKRAEEAITGSARMGNEGGIGNAEAAWGASSDDFGKDLVKRIKSSTKKRSEQTPTSKMFGDDWEVTKDKSHKPYALDENNAFNKGDMNKTKVTKNGEIFGYYSSNTEGVKIYDKDNKLIKNILDTNYTSDDAMLFLDKYYKMPKFENNNNNKTQIKESMKRLKFKNEFNGVGNALKLIPESYRVDNKEFEMTDGNETYRIRWEGNLKEGNAVVLTATDKKMVNEDMARMKALFNYKSQDTLGLVKGNARIDENKVFSDVWNKSKRLLGESEEIEGQTADKEAPFEEADVNQAAEAKKHVHMGTASTDKGTVAPKPKVGHWEDNVKGQAAEAKKHVEGSESTDKGGVAPAPKKGEWEEIKKKAPEATEHLNESEEEEDFGTHIDGSKLPNPKDNMVTEEDEEFDLDSEEEIEVDDEDLDGEEEETETEVEPSDDDVSDEPELGDDAETEMPAVASSNVRLLQSPSTGEYFIEKDGKNLKVEDMYLDIASNRELGNGAKRAKMILDKMQAQVDGEEIEEGFGDFLRSNDKIFFNNNKEAIANAAMLSDETPQKRDAFEMLQKAANKWGKEKGYESGSLTSLKNELRRKIYGGQFSGSQS